MDWDDDREIGGGRWEGWRTPPARQWEAVTFPGDHFFLRSAAPALLAYLAQSFPVLPLQRRVDQARDDH